MAAMLIKLSTALIYFFKMNVPDDDEVTAASINSLPVNDNLSYLAYAAIHSLFIATSRFYSMLYWTRVSNLNN